MSEVWEIEDRSVEVPRFTGTGPSVIRFYEAGVNVAADIFEPSVG